MTTDDEIEQLRAEIERLRERLEINHYYRMIDGEMKRVEAEPGEIEAYDGIACRNETIRLQDQTIDRLLAEIKELKGRPMSEPWPENVTGDVIIVKAGELVTRPPTQEELTKTAESAYRRGYQQGAYSALIAALAGAPLRYLLNEWAGGQLHNWRYHKNRSRGYPPPEPRWGKRR